MIEPPDQETGKGTKGISAILPRHLVTEGMDSSDIEIGQVFENVEQRFKQPDASLLCQ